MRRAAAVLAVLGCALPVAACGFGPGKSSGDVELTVTRDYGSRTVGQVAPAKTSGADTVMRYLQRHFKVRTRYGGGFVQSIDGLAGRRSGSRPFDWFYYVNGVEAEQGAASIKLQPGDRVWWDYHDWGTTMSSPAVVGSYPEPFLHGLPGGKRLPIRVECPNSGDKGPCKAISDRLDKLGVLAGQSVIGTVSGDETLRVVVGPWSQVRVDLGAQLIERGPRASGVFARMIDGGHRMQVLDPQGHVVRTLGAGTGLIAATRFSDQPPTWFVTGTDAAGVRQAVEGFGVGELANRFALAVHDDQGIPLPATGGRG